MPKMLGKKNRKLLWVTAIANVTAPTVSELTGGIELQWKVSANNFQLGVSDEEKIEDAPLAGVTNISSPGRNTITAEMDFFKFTTTPEDTAFTTFSAAGLYGFLVLRKGKLESTAIAAADVVEVYEVVTGTPMPQTPDGNGAGFEKFRLIFHPQGNFSDRAVVAA